MAVLNVILSYWIIGTFALLNFLVKQLKHICIFLSYLNTEMVQDVAVISNM